MLLHVRFFEEIWAKYCEKWAILVTFSEVVFKCVYENGDWFHCVALCELVWMHCVDFSIFDLLERYRQNTAEPSPPSPPMQALICRGLVEVQDTLGVAPEKPLISEVNHLRAWVVLGWVTTWEVQFRWQILSDVSASFKQIEWCRHHHRLRLHATLKSYIWRVYKFKFFTVCSGIPPIVSFNSIFLS